MEKPLFSITCATCQARLAVRSEAAIGAILECPKCRSMVQVTPPPGWTPPQPPVAGASETQQPPTAVSPPVSGTAPALQAAALEPAGPSVWRAMLQTWMLWGGVPLVTLVAIVSVLWALLAPPASEPAATDAEQAAVETEKPKAEQSSAAPSRDTKSAEKEKPTEKKAEKISVAKETKKSATKSEAKSEAKSPAKQSETSKKTKSSNEETVSSKKTAEAVEEKSPTAVAEEKSESKEKETTAAVSEVKKEAEEEKKNAEVKKLPPTAVDLAARCADPVAAMELTDMPLIKAVDLLAGMSTLSITIDVDALEQLGVSLRDPVSLEVSSTTIAKTLRAIAAQKGLVFTAEGGQVFLGAPAKYREIMQKVRYSVADLTGDDKTATAELAALIQNMVAPDSWQAAGGRGTLKADPGAIEVTQSGDVQDQILIFCEKLRAARGKPLQTHDRAERFALATRWDRARKMLEQRVTVNYHQPTSLWKILAFLSNSAHGDIVVDRAALAAVDTSDSVETTVTVVKQPLDKTLTALLQPLGLTYRAIGARTIQVTTKEAADERFELEFYLLGSLAAEKKNVGQFVIDELKKKAVALSLNTGGNLFYDAPSQCLIVLQPQAVQIAVERLLREKEAERKEKEKEK